MSLAFLSAASNGARGTSTSVTITINSGDTVVVVTATDVSGSAATNVTDSGGSTYTKKASIANGAVQVDIWVALSAQASTSVTATNASNSGDIVAIVGRYSGVAALGATATNTGSTANPTISLTT